jgi:hypothetical protein
MTETPVETKKDQDEMADHLVGQCHFGEDLPASVPAPGVALESSKPLLRTGFITAAGFNSTTSNPPVRSRTTNVPGGLDADPDCMAVRSATTGERHSFAVGIGNNACLATCPRRRLTTRR